MEPHVRQMSDHPSSRPRHTATRRGFLRLAGLGAAGGSVVFLTTCGGDDERKPGGTGGAKAGAARADLKILNSALDLENASIAAYSAGLKLLKRPALAAAELFLGHEREHARRLTTLIGDMGGTPNTPRTPEEYRRAFPALGDQGDALRFAVDLENMAVRAYVESLPRLSEPALRQTAGTIVTNEAEHMAVLRGLLGERQAPDAFVTGKS